MRGARSSLFVAALFAAVTARAQTPALDALFTDPQLAETRAVVIMQDGRIVAERYGKGYGRANRFIGWSMSKSITSTIIGDLVGEGRLQLDAPAPVAEWAHDARAKITLRQLLHMSSGLRHDELGDPGVEDSDTNRAFIRRRLRRCGGLRRNPARRKPAGHQIRLFVADHGDPQRHRGARHRPRRAQPAGPPRRDVRLFKVAPDRSRDAQPDLRVRRRRHDDRRQFLPRHRPRLGAVRADVPGRRQGWRQAGRPRRLGCLRPAPRPRPTPAMAGISG